MEIDKTILKSQELKIQERKLFAFNERKISFNEYNKGFSKVLKCGYFLFDNFDKNIITELFYVKNYTDMLCGGTWFNNGLTDSFSYYVEQINPYQFSIQADVFTIPSLCKTNIGRKAGKLKCFPFIKEIDMHKAMYIVWESFSLHDNNEITAIENDIKEIIEYFSNRNIKCIFKEVVFNNVIQYC